MDAAEEPAATGSVMDAPAAGSVLEAPVAKAAGPAGPPPPVMVPDEPNLSGSTVHGVLLEEIFSSRFLSKRSLLFRCRPSSQLSRSSATFAMRCRRQRQSAGTEPRTWPKTVCTA